MIGPDFQERWMIASEFFDGCVRAGIKMKYPVAISAYAQIS